MRNKKYWFTLVELVVVMTLITILGTIWYVYFETNLGESRDAKREADMTQIVGLLELYQVWEWNFPKPSNAVNITYSWSAVAWVQWTFWKKVWAAIWFFGEPVDPLFWNEYTYSTTARANEFQIASIKESFKQEEWLGELALNRLVSSADAASIETAYVLGDYNGFMVRVNDGSTEHFIATPSIISNDITDTDVVSVVMNQKLVYDQFFNLPHSYAPHLSVDWGFNFNVLDPVVYTGQSNELKSEAKLLEFNEKLKYIYATTPTESFDTYASVLEKDWLTGLKWFLTRKFRIPFRSYFNCKDILDDGLAEGSRLYEIDPDGPDGEPAYQVYCDMETDGWGWTRVGDNHITNGDFASWSWVLGAIENAGETNEIVALSTPVDGNNYALHQTGNYSSNYQVTFDDPSVLKAWYEVRMSMWRSDYGSWSLDSGTSNTTILSGKTNPWSPGTCAANPPPGSFPYCFFSYFNQKMANPANFGPWWNLTDIDITLVDQSNTVTTSYLEGGILFDWYIPSNSSQVRAGTTIYPYSSSEMEAINEWVEAWGFLLSTNDISDWDPIGEYYNMPSWNNHENVSKYWEIANVDHPLVNGSIGLWVDLRGKTLIWDDAYSGLIGTPLPDDIILARDQYSPFLPTAILRKHGKGFILFVSDEWVFRNMSSGNTFNAGDNEDAFAAAIMAYAIETAAGINPHEWYVFHNRIHYNDGTFSTNGEDITLETIVVDDGWTDRVWTREQTRHRIYKTPEEFNWYIWLDANNNKDLYFTWLRLELFYR